MNHYHVTKIIIVVSWQVIMGDEIARNSEKLLPENTLKIVANIGKLSSLSNSKRSSGGHSSDVCIEITSFSHDEKKASFDLALDEVNVDEKATNYIEKFHKKTRSEFE